MGAGKLNIVVVEDEAIIADHIMMSLRTLGFRPWGPAMNLKEAIGYVERGPVDLVLIDINLNGENDGIQLGHHLKQHHSVPHVFLTANKDPKTVQAAKWTVPMGYIVKPFQRSELYSNIEIAMSNWQLLQAVVHPQLNDSGPVETAEAGVFFVQINGRRIRIFADEIVVVTGAHVYVQIELQNGVVHVVRASMNQILKNLSPQRFFRIHRSHIVNLSYAEQFDGRFLLVKGRAFPVSKNRKQRLIELFPSLG
jgi:DNA-binding LytR/AlgR family response regulator